LAEDFTNPGPDVSPAEQAQTSPSYVSAPEETGPVVEQAPAEENEQPQEAEEKAETEEESDPFADILQENKDKKRYSPNPLPPQASEEG
jgi:hypothetical protein